MQKLLITAVLFIFCLGGIAQANGNDRDMDNDKDDNTYVKGSVGIFMMEDTIVEFEGAAGSFEWGEASADTGFGMTAAIGRSFGPVDLELEYAYRETSEGEVVFNDSVEYDGKKYDLAQARADLTGTFTVKTFMINAIYNMENSSAFTPYAGGGFGGAWIKDKAWDNTKLAYQLMAGVGFDLTKHTTFLVGYRYIGMEDITAPVKIGLGEMAETYGEDSASMDIHNIEFGLKYSF